MSWTIFKELLGLHCWYLTESTYAWRAFTAYSIFHDSMIQKGVAALRIISIKKLCRGSFSKKFLAYIVDTWLKVLIYWIFHDSMIQKGMAGLRIISIKNFVVDYFQRSSCPKSLILDWKYLCMKSKYCMHTGLSWSNDRKGQDRTWNNS